MTTRTRSKAGLALFAAAAFTLCIPAHAAGPRDHRRGDSHAQRPSMHQAPQRHRHQPPPRAPQRHHDRDRGGSGLGILLGIAALGALIIATSASSEPDPVPVALPTAPNPGPPPPPVVQQQLPAGYWYYCAEANAYYPYVQYCPGGWQQVMPRN